METSQITENMEQITGSRQVRRDRYRIGYFGEMGKDRGKSEMVIKPFVSSNGRTPQFRRLDSSPSKGSRLKYVSEAIYSLLAHQKTPQEGSFPCALGVPRDNPSAGGELYVAGISFASRRPVARLGLGTASGFFLLKKITPPCTVWCRAPASDS